MAAVALAKNHKLNRHWRYLYHRRRRWHGVSTAQIVASQMFTVIASVAAGLLLDFNKETIAFLVGALLMMPGIIDLAASLTGVMCAKINHQIDTLNQSTWRVTLRAVGFALFVGATAGLIVGFVGGLLAMWLFGASLIKMVLLAVISMSIIGGISYPMMALFTLLVRRLNMNPDNISGPVESSVVDIIAILVIAIVAGWVAWKNTQPSRFGL